MVAMGAPYRPRGDAILARCAGTRPAPAIGIARRARRARALVLASCSSGPSSPPGHGTATTHRPAPALGPRRPPRRLRPARRSPPVATSGPLQAGVARSRCRSRPTASPPPRAPTAPCSRRRRTRPTRRPPIAWVVDGNGPAAIAEHVATGIAALAADGTNFYVATYSERVRLQPRQRQPGRAVEHADASMRPTAPTTTWSPWPRPGARCSSR